MAGKTRRRTATKTRSVDPNCLSNTISRLGATVHPHEAPVAAAAVEGAPSRARDASLVRSSFRLLMMRGLTPLEAGNVVAYMTGLHATESGWTVKQIERMLLLRSLVACGRLAS